MNADRISDGDSAIIPSSSAIQPDLLQLFETGKRIVVGFRSDNIPDDLCLASYREQIRQLIKEHQCTEFAFDLKPFKKIQSGTLGLIASVRNEGVKVFAFNLSPDVREVFEISRLDQAVEMYDPRAQQE
jgi:anti-sigma B factor antagonist